MATDPFAGPLDVCDTDKLRPLPRASAREPRGVCDLPPLDVESYLVRGDSGLARWVTSSGSRRRRAHDAGAAAVANDLVWNEGSSGSSSDDGDDGPRRTGCDPSAIRGSTTRAPPGSRRKRPRESALCVLDGEVTISELLRQVHATAGPRVDRCDGAVPLSQPPIGVEERRTTEDVERALWTTKYSPRSFRELLSDETINLNLLQWLKEWDAYVFGDAHANDDDDDGGGPGSGVEAEHGSGGAVGGESMFEEGPSSTGPPKRAREKVGRTADAQRPEVQMVVLAGPPGVGKTTLVHVLAAHCGYDVVEINASADRNATRIQHLIQLTVSQVGGKRPRSASLRGRAMAAVVGGKENPLPGAPASPRGVLQDTLAGQLLRPKCLVIDEIDGIAANVVPMLMQLDIHRPVFCLCNDVYAPTLRPLRQNQQRSWEAAGSRGSHVSPAIKNPVLIFHIPSLHPQRLLLRLEHILSCETADRQHASRQPCPNGRQRPRPLTQLVPQPALVELIRISNGDVRSCVNTLQFLCRQLGMESEAPRERSPPAVTEGHPSPRPKRRSVMDVIRDSQAKDIRMSSATLYELLFHRRDRQQYVQLLKRDFSVDIHAMAPSAPTPSTDSPAHPGALPAEASAQQHHGQETPETSVGITTRMDPGSLYVRRTLQRYSDASSLFDGLFEFYPHVPYQDYSLDQTEEFAALLSFHDANFFIPMSSAATASSVGMSSTAGESGTDATSGGSSTLVRGPFSDHFARVVTVPACFSRCSTRVSNPAMFVYRSRAARTGNPAATEPSAFRSSTAFPVPRERQQQHYREMEAITIAREWRSGLRAAKVPFLPRVALEPSRPANGSSVADTSSAGHRHVHSDTSLICFYPSSETISREVVPFLLRSLVEASAATCYAMQPFQHGQAGTSAAKPLIFAPASRNGRAGDRDGDKSALTQSAQRHLVYGLSFHQRSIPLYASQYSSSANPMTVSYGDLYHSLSRGGGGGSRGGGGGFSAGGGNGNASLAGGRPSAGGLGGTDEEDRPSHIEFYDITPEIHHLGGIMPLLSLLRETAKASVPSWRKSAPYSQAPGGGGTQTRHSGSRSLAALLLSDSQRTSSGTPVPLIPSFFWTDQVKEFMAAEIRRCLVSMQAARDVPRHRTSKPPRSSAPPTKRERSVGSAEHHSVQPEKLFRVDPPANLVDAVDGVAESSSTGATPVTVPPGGGPPVKRDMFGRPMVPKPRHQPVSRPAVRSAAAAEATTAAAPSKVEVPPADGRSTAGGGPHAGLTVSYTYFDGFTNAVKIPAVLTDF